MPILAKMEARVTRQREAARGRPRLVARYENLLASEGLAPDQADYFGMSEATVEGRHREQSRAHAYATDPSASPLLLDEIGEPLTDADGMGHRAVYVKPTRQYPYDNVSALHDDWFGGEREAYLHLPVVVDSPAVKAWAKSNEQGSTDESVGDDPLAGIWQRELAGKLGEALANIPPDQAAVLRMRAGMNQAARPHTMREVGDLLSVSVVEVQRRENRGSSLLRHPTRSAGLHAYLSGTVETAFTAAEMAEPVSDRVLPLDPIEPPIDQLLLFAGRHQPYAEIVAGALARTIGDAVGDSLDELVGGRDDFPRRLSAALLRAAATEIVEAGARLNDPKPLERDGTPHDHLLPRMAEETVSDGSLRPQMVATGRFARSYGRNVQPRYQDPIFLTGAFARQIVRAAMDSFYPTEPLNQ